MREYRLAVIPADGIGQETVPQAMVLLDTLAEIDGGFRFRREVLPWGSQYYFEHGAMMPTDALQTLDNNYDAIYLGPVGDPRLPDDVTLWGLLIPIRQTFDQYVNLRPIRLLPGVRGPLRDKDPADVDIVFVRENTEGEYSGVGGRARRGSADEVVIQTTVFTRRGTERVIRYAFEYARTHDRRRVTSATKSNAMQHAMVFWDEVFAQVAADYPDLEHDQYLIDALCARLVLRPETLDVVVGSNLFGDILTDIGAAIGGSMGLAPSANLDPERRHPSLFQPVHGSAPDIAGQGIANPIGDFWSLQLMLDFLGEQAAADLVMRAIEAVLADGKALTPDLGGKASTAEVSEAVRDAARRLAASAG
jgi:tartrate dehydrogenase/decarboxylase / D-malate dehydrogenase